ncbi:epimerase [Agromyces luteolus]|uniref:NAD-dependent epimerase/dehydratase family protein n=1 Tax=Agromyces luteolus TaxID=88373 RepID=A0A7C9HHF0_9MICO|nr:NAD-dependent epimerase/dehydratase family protein [Agromyces luteolus]MUN07026.1 NAD-dependent epimerase/dehydratase family protein [Agromyces luteolus]GLK28366.1 epimerase [Agromyces luteolus]
MRALVVGANGFLGSHLVDALAVRGHDVTAFDRFSTDRRAFDADVPVVRGDFTDTEAVARAVSGHDRVFHFVSSTTPATAGSDPVLDVRGNVIPSIALLRACAEQGVERVYFASSGGAVYGDLGASPVHEERSPHPVSPYGIGKLTVESYLGYFARTAGLASVALRISNPYGPRQRATHGQGLIPIALRAIAAGDPVLRFGDGSMVRDYLYVDDAIRMIGSIVEAEPDHLVYNIGSGHGTTVNEVIAGLSAVTGIDPRVEQRDQPPTFVQASVLDISRFAAEFGRPELTPLHEGLERTWAALRGPAA